MLIQKICKHYRHLLDNNRTYSAAELAAIIRKRTQKGLKTLQNSPLFFRLSENGGITLDCTYFE